MKPKLCSLLFISFQISRDSRLPSLFFGGSVLFKLSKYEVPLIVLAAFAFVFGVSLKGLLLAWLFETLFGCATGVDCRSDAAKNQRNGINLNCKT